MKDAGIIGFVPRGEYSDTETYDFLQFVYYGDSSYVAKKETTGHPPEENNEFWQLLAKGRVVGVTGVKGNSEAEYRTGDVNITADDIGALSSSGGTISGSTNPLLALKRLTEGASSSLKLIPANGIKGGILFQTNYRESGNQFLVIRQNELNEILNLFAVSESQRQIHDYKTGTLKEILVNGEALPATGGTLKGNTFYILKLERANNVGCGIEFCGTAGTVGNIQMTFDSNSGPEFRCFVKDQDTQKDYSVFYASRDRRMIYSKEAKGLKQIMVDGDVSFFQAGEIVEFPNVNNSFSGYVSNGTKTIYFSVPFIKSVEKRTILLEASQINVRTVGKYILNQVMSSNYKINTVQKVGNIATFTIENLDSSVFLNVENNTTVSVSGNFKFTFS